MNLSRTAFTMEIDFGTESRARRCHWHTIVLIPIGDRFDSIEVKSGSPFVEMHTF